MSLNPLISTPHLVLLFAVLLVFVTWVAWRSSARCSRVGRLAVTLCRALLVAGLALVVLNPGSWTEQRENEDSHWGILVDRSLSMATEDAGQAGTMERWQLAGELVADAKSAAGDASSVELAVFAGDLEKEIEDDAGLDSVTPDGRESDLAAAVASQLNRSRSAAGRLTGLLVFSDGRQTNPLTDAQRREQRRVALMARAQQVPVYTVALGGEVAARDVTVETRRRQFVAFAGQQCSVTAMVMAEGLGEIRTGLVLESSVGVEIAKQEVNLKPGVAVPVSFVLDAPPVGNHQYRFRVPEWQGEHTAANNEAGFSLTVLDDQMRIFMAEGAPYWDSKFLAQMIRQQQNMRITSVYRLAADRFFRVETGDERPADASGAIFPDSDADLSAYDLIVFGKGAEYFLNAERIARLDEFVRERGGTVLFTRGKPYSGEFAELEYLEPVTWGERVSMPFALQPTDAGVEAGLFGGLLPGRDSALWNKLPSLGEANTTLALKPFTRTLLEGRHQVAGANQMLPVLLSRRYGKGLIVALNADGLWKWDFSSEKDGSDLGGQYETFWSQIIQWALTYSEFLPGQDLALRLDRSIVYPDESVRATVLHRSAGAGTGHDTGESALPIAPTLEIVRAGTVIETLTPSRLDDRIAEWQTAVSAAEPASYTVRVLSGGEPGPSMPLTVLPPPSERDQLSADPEFLKNFAGTSGGRPVAATAEEIAAVVAELESVDRSVDLDRATWQPLWDRWWWLTILLAIAAVEWCIRRRSGLL